MFDCLEDDGIAVDDGSRDARHRIAVADVNGGLGLNSVDTSLQRFDAPLRHLVGIAAERRLVELNDGRSQGIQRLRLRVQRFGERQGECPLVTVVGIECRVGDRQRAGQGDLERNGRLALEETRIPLEDRIDALDGADTLAARCEAAAIAGPLLHQIVVVESFHARGDIGHPRLSALLTIADDVDTRRDLVMDGDTHSVVKGLFEGCPFECPVRALAVHLLRSLVVHGIALHEPAWLGQAADHGSQECFGHISPLLLTCSAKRRRLASSPWP